MARRSAKGPTARPHGFDATTKHLLEVDPAAWLGYAGFPVEHVTVVNADVSTVTAAGDRALKVHAEHPWLGHVENQSSHDPTLPERALEYNVLLGRRHGLPVRSIVVLLRREADGPDLTGVLRQFDPDGSCYLEFHYRVVRAWDQRLEPILAGGLGALPMAPLTDEAARELPAVIQRMDERIRREASPGKAGVLWAATYVLLGLRYLRDVAAGLLKGVRAMRESTTYQAIIEEGEALGIQNAVLRIGTRRLGRPSAHFRRILQGVTEVREAERLVERVLDVASWQELLEP